MSNATDPQAVPILLVDDRPEDLRALQEMLSTGGYTLVTANSGTQALKEILRHDFAVILLDLLMPGMDGFEVASIIKQRERSRYTPIIFLTAAGDDWTALGAYSVGAVDYLAKPIDDRLLLAKVAVFAQLFAKDQRIKHQAEELRERELHALRSANETRYRNLADAIPQIVWTATKEGAVTSLNRRWSDYSGLGAKDGEGGGWLAIVHPDQATMVSDRWHEGLAQEAVFEIECQLRRHDGVYRWHLGRATPDRDADGKVLGWLGTYTDYDDLKRAHEEAQQAIRLRDEFLSIASHELRTPLATLTLQSDGLLRSQADANDPGSQQLFKRATMMRKQILRLDHLIDNLLDVSRIAGGRLQMELEKVDLGQVVTGVADQLQADLEGAGCKLISTIGPHVNGRWSRTRLEQVVGNLLGNAIKYGRGKPIEVFVGRANGRATFRVIDQGIGISEESRTRIFGRFERAVSVRNYGGLGLGLWISRQIVEALGGTIAVESKENEGSTFTVELPCQL